MLPNYFVYVVDMGGYTPAILDSLIIRRVPKAYTKGYILMRKYSPGVTFVQHFGVVRWKNAAD